MVLWDGSTRGAWRWFHGRSESEQLAVLEDGSFEFRVAPGDKFGGSSGERAELVHTGEGCETGRECWWAWETMHPEDFVVKSLTGWNIEAQFHHSGSVGSPNIDYSVDTTAGEQRRVNVRGGDIASPSKRGVSFVPLLRGVWNETVTRVRWVSNDIGLVQTWVDGTQVLEPTPFPTLYQGQTCYFKLGFYRGAWDQVTRILHRNVRCGETYLDVA